MRRLWHLTGYHRAPSTNQLLFGMLAFNAGAVNAGGFLAVAVYTSHMSGFVSALADNLILGNTLLALGALGSLCSFFSGAMASSWMIDWARQRRLRSEYALPLVLEACLMLVFGVMGAGLMHHHTPFAVPLTVLLLSFIMGLQNALSTRMSSAAVRTTHMTGVLTDLGIECAKALFVNRGAQLAVFQVRSNKAHLKRQALLLGMFLAGGTLGAFGFKTFGFGAVMPLALIWLALALPPLVMDWQHRCRKRQPQRSA